MVRRFLHISLRFLVLFSLVFVQILVFVLLAMAWLGRIGDHLFRGVLCRDTYLRGFFVAESNVLVAEELDDAFLLLALSVAVL